MAVCISCQEDSYTPWGDLLTTDMIPHPTQDLSSVQESSSEDSVDVKRYTSGTDCASL